MPALISLSIHRVSLLVRALSRVGGAAGRGLTSLARIVRNRRDASKLARLDDHMLADIGLTRSDLRDAYSESLWRDPTNVLAQRASERRASRRAIRGTAIASGCYGVPMNRPARRAG